MAICQVTRYIIECNFNFISFNCELDKTVEVTNLYVYEKDSEYVHIKNF